MDYKGGVYEIRAHWFRSVHSGKQEKAEP